MGDETGFRDFAVRLAAPAGTSGVEGDARDAAARELLARFSARLVATARRRLSPRLQAKVSPEDVLQSVLRTFFRRLDAGEIELRDWGGLWGYLALTTLYKCRRNAVRYAAAKRDAAREVSLSVTGPGGPCELAVPDREPTPEEAAAFADELESLLSGLDGRDRETVELLLAGESADAVAGRLACSRRTVRRTVARLRARVLARDERRGRIED